MAGSSGKGIKLAHVKKWGEGLAMVRTRQLVHQAYQIFNQSKFIKWTTVSKIHVDTVNECWQVKWVGEENCPYNVVSFVPNLDYRM